ncbi:hypothetical protein [Pseudomonas sp. NPDC089734]|uniref:hypothetical protein n=1 Tax=Pseudomonas sp. NPDC089734 TaxID=3364469 RepID=UPI00380EFDC8
MRRALYVSVLTAVAGLAQAQTPAPFDCTNLFKFGANPGATWTAFEQSPETMAWNWFACLNQPAAQGSINRLWETLKPTDQVYLSNGAQPLPYAEREKLPIAVQAKALEMGMNMQRVFQNLDSVQQVDGLILQMGNQVPEAQRGKPVRFHLQMSEDTFNYIVQQQVYNANGQAALTSNLNFPSTAWELKTSWLWIGADQAFMKQLSDDGYYIIQAYYLEDDEKTYNVGYAALSGMHVINKLSPNWVWTTFENKHNSKYSVTNAAPAQPMTNSTGPTPAAQPVNSAFQAQYPGLAQYELIGVQYQNSGQLLANSQLESAFQSNSDCLACHSTAAYSKTKGYFNFALPEKDGIAYPLKELPDSAYAGYEKLDFVWSLKRAHWKR